MTQTPILKRNAHRRATALLLAAVALPTTVAAQDTVTPPSVTPPAQTAPASAPVQPPRVVVPANPQPTVQTPPSSAPAGESRTTIAPGVAEQAAQEARERAARQDAASEARREQAARRNAASAPPPAPAPLPAEPVDAAPPPVADNDATAPVDVASQAVPDAVPPVADTSVPTDDIAAPPSESGGTMWLILAALGGLAALVAAVMLLRRRREPIDAGPYAAEPDTVSAAAVQPDRPVMADRPVVAAPVATRQENRDVADPVAAAPVFIARPDREDRPIAKKATAKAVPATAPVLARADVVTPDADDIAAILSGATKRTDRPQLELAMRPTQAGMSSRGARIDFELTVANAGAMRAEHVRIGAFMLGDNATATSDIERLLINPPADQVIDAERIEPGDGKRLDASISLPRDQVDEIVGEGGQGFVPVLVADARYRLPDGSEGRTCAAFTVGRTNSGTQLEPIALHDDPATYADIEARLHSVPAKV